MILMIFNDSSQEKIQFDKILKNKNFFIVPILLLIDII